MWAEEADKHEITVCVNRTPITTPVWMTPMKDKTLAGLSGCNLSDEKASTACGITVGRGRHFWLFVNITTPHMPVTTNGKGPNLSPLGTVLVQTIEKAIRKAKQGSRGRKQVSQKSIIIDNLDQAIQKTSGGGKYRYPFAANFRFVCGNGCENVCHQPPGRSR